MSVPRYWNIEQFKCVPMYPPGGIKTLVNHVQSLCVACSPFNASYGIVPRLTPTRFGGFCGGMFVVGSGLSTLETSANPFIAMCGPPRYSEIRLTLAQSFQAVGTVVAPLLASKVLFKDVTATSSLQNVQWVYLVC